MWGSMPPHRVLPGMYTGLTFDISTKSENGHNTYSALLPEETYVAILGFVPKVGVGTRMFITVYNRKKVGNSLNVHEEQR